MISLLITFVIKMKTQQNVEKNAKCGDFFSNARSNAKLIINFFGLKNMLLNVTLFDYIKCVVNQLLVIITSILTIKRYLPEAATSVKGSAATDEIHVSELVPSVGV